MKKTDKKGFVLLETLVATVLVSGILIFMFSQFSSLANNYDETNRYNNVQEIYALNTIANYISSDWTFYNTIDIEEDEYINITDCSKLTNSNLCKKIFEYENIDTILIVKNHFNSDKILDYDDDFLNFLKKIPFNEKTKEKYRLVAQFKNNMFATIRFGDSDE